MPGRRRNCTACGETWRGEDARFCGSCGATLDDTGAPPPNSQTRRGRPTLGHVAVIAAVAAVGIAGVVASGTDLPRPGGGPDDTVDLDEEPPTADTPLSEDEADGLLADAAALRCEPRGCELWRLNVRDRAGDGMAGVAQIGDVVLLPTGQPTADPEPDAGTTDGDATGEDESSGVAPPAQGSAQRFTAVDIDTGDVRWEHEVAGSFGGVRLIGAGGLGVFVTGNTVVALDEDGEVRWEWDHRADRDDEAEHSMRGITHDDERLIVASYRTGATGGDVLVALDLATGELLWRHEQLLGSLALPDVVAKIDGDGQLRRLDLATGEARWEADGGPFEELQTATDYLVGYRPDGRLSVHDPDDGRTLLEVEEVVGAGVTVSDDAFFGAVLPDSDPEDIAMGQFTPAADDPTIEVVRIELGGDEQWRTELPVDGTPTSCCGFHQVSDDVVAVTVDGELYHLDPTDGEYLGSDELSSLGQGGETTDTWITLPSGLELRSGAGGQRIDLRTPDGAQARVSSDQQVNVVSEDPLVVSDGDTFMGVELLDDGADEGG